MTILVWADYLGIFVFAISGGLAAIRHDMDLFGILIVALFPAIGGGTLRDLLLDVPVFWLSQPWVICIGVLGGIAAIIYKSWTKVKLLIWVDALGLALFAMVGTYKAFELGHGFVTVVMMGTITATAGGLIRDVVCGGPPLLLQEDVYALAALFGSSTGYVGLALGAPVEVSLSCGFACAFVIRALAIQFGLSVPKSDWARKKLYGNSHRDKRDS